MARKRHSLAKIHLLQYALEGARSQLGQLTYEDDSNDEHAEELEKDIAEIQRRIKLVQHQNALHEADEVQA